MYILVFSKNHLSISFINQSFFCNLTVEVDLDTMEPKNNLSSLAVDWCKEMGAHGVKTVDDILEDKSSKSYSLCTRGPAQTNSKK